MRGRGENLPDIPQSAEDRACALQDVEEGCKTGIYQDISAVHARRAKKEGKVISSALVVWQEGYKDRKGRFGVNLSKQPKCWKKGTVRMESLSEFAIEMQKGDQFIYVDIQKGSRQFRLHPPIRDWFVFRYSDKYYQYVVLPFGCGRSILWFTMPIAIFVG